MHIYVNNDISKWNVQQLGIENSILYSELEKFKSIESENKLAVFHLPFPFSDPTNFNTKFNQVFEIVKIVIVLVSELHDTTVEFCRSHCHPKIKYFLCGHIDNFDSSDWMDWFITTSYFYKNSTVLEQLTPYQTKSKTFDILLGLPRPHRDIIYNHINSHDLNDQVVMTYLGHPWKIIAGQDHPGWIWEKDGVDTSEANLHWSISLIKYYGQNMSLSQVVPISIYNQAAFSIVTETNFNSAYVFHTEKIVKPIIARRLFIVFGGHHYLQNLHRLGFKTFGDIIDESYDNEPDYELRGKMICDQISYLLQQNQKTILNSIKSITEHNYRVMMDNDWYANFAKELRALLLEHAG